MGVWGDAFSHAVRNYGMFRKGGQIVKSLPTKRKLSKLRVMRKRRVLKS